jgi:hypothetical protein
MHTDENLRFLIIGNDAAGRHYSGTMLPAVIIGNDAAGRRKDRL